MRRLDRLAAILVCTLGVAHLAAGYRAFAEPTEPRIWFASAGFLLLVTGLANLAAARVADRLTAAAAMIGNLSILITGVLLASANPALLLAPQTLVLLALGAMLIAFRCAGLARSNPPHRAGL